MTLNQLRYFNEVCQCGYVNRAAENLYVSQPSISVAIKELEEELKVRLFYRKLNRLILTAEGVEFKKLVQKLLSEFDDLQQRMTDLGASRPVRIGVSPMISVFLFAPLYSDYLSKYPDANIEMIECGSIESQTKLKNRELDLSIIIASPDTCDKFHVMPLVKTQMLFCVAKNHPLAKEKTVDFSMLSNEKIVIMKSSSHQTGALILNRFQEIGIVPKILMRSSQIYLIKQCILNQGAGGFLMDDILRMETDIVGIPVTPPINLDIALIWSKEESLNTSSSRFMEFISTYKPK